MINLFFSVMMNLALATPEKACLLETNSTMMGIKLEIKDCAENVGMPASQFKSYCKSFSQAAVSMGAPAAKITYLEKCPTPFQGKCDVSKNAKSNFYYYKRSTEDLKTLPASCKALGGTYAQAKP